jgi:branched-chain amino acid transport system permease protein
MADNAPAQNDRAQEVLARWDARIRQRLIPLVTEELIAEHARNPLGQHSDALERLLNYFRRAAPAGKLAVMCTRPFREWRIVEIAGVRGQPPRFHDDRVFHSEREAIHAVFLERLDGLMRD